MLRLQHREIKTQAEYYIAQGDQNTVHKFHFCEEAEYYIVSFDL
jgi:hypothetical protein